MAHPRDRRIDTIKRRLVQNGMPRLQMSLIILFTGLAGFFTSFSLLQLGLTTMWVRYPLAILIAYCVFLLLLRLWLWLQRRSIGPNVDVPVPDFDFSTASSADETLQFGGGGGFGGGGAGGTWGTGISPLSSASASDVVKDGVSFDLNLEEGWLVVLAVIALVGGLVASLYIVYIAPVLLAEILVDGALVAGLYKRVQPIEQRHWLRTAIRRTILPAMLVATFFGVAGYAMQGVVPMANSIGEVWAHLVGD